MKTLNFFAVFLGVAGLFSVQKISAQQKVENLRPAIDEPAYNTAIGLRAGETSGMTFKHFFKDDVAFEAIIGIWPYALGITGLSEVHKPAFDTEGMKWYYGGGGHITLGTNRIYSLYRKGDRFYYRYTSGKSAIGLDGILGLEYKIRPIPLALSLDMKPFVEINNDGFLYLSVDPGLGIKVAF